MRPVLVAGVHAAGKSTVGNLLSMVTGMPFFEYADFMLPVIGTEDRSRVLQIPFDARRPIYEAANAAIADLFSSSTEHSLGLLTIHLSLRLKGRLETFEENHYRTLDMAAILLIEADPALIYARRAADRTRLRSTESIAEISEQQQHNRHIALRLALTHSVSTMTFSNNHKEPALQEVTTWLSELTRARG